MTLTEFLLARIAEDETAARSAFTDGWRPLNDVDELRVDHCIPIRTARHMKAWQPSRVLAECDAKRRIIAMCDEGCECGASGTTLGNWWPSDILAALAQPYADHPDFEPDWKIA